MTALLGQNGAGKSTVINLIVGLIPPTSGECTVCGVPLHGEHRAKAIEKVQKYLATLDSLSVRLPSGQRLMEVLNVVIRHGLLPVKLIMLGRRPQPPPPGQPRQPHQPLPERNFLGQGGGERGQI